MVLAGKSGDFGAIARGGAAAATEMGPAGTGPDVTPSFAMVIGSV